MRGWRDQGSILLLAPPFSFAVGSDGFGVVEDLRVLRGVRDRAGDPDPGGEQGVPGDGGHVHALPP